MAKYVGFRQGKVHESYVISEYYCGGCGYPVTDHDSFCPECGGAFHKCDADDESIRRLEAENTKLRQQCESLQKPYIHNINRKDYKMTTKINDEIFSDAEIDVNMKNVTPITTDEKLNMSSPWIEHARKIYSMFKDDPDIRMEYDSENITLIMYVSDDTKASALDKILMTEIEFGNVTLTISIRPANVIMSKDILFRRAFAGNPNCVDINLVKDFTGNDIIYVSFENKVVQYFNDMIDDSYGIESTLFEDIARDIFGTYDDSLVFFDTDISNPYDEDPIMWPVQ